MRNKKGFIAFSFIMAFILTGCLTGRKLQNKIDVEKKRLLMDEERGADMCAPYYLARAKSEIVFAEKELFLGNIHTADDHISKEKNFSLKASENASVCIPGDKDSDGIPDEEDACPLKPGPEKFDGCPDTDGDGIPDHKDECLNKPGPAENNGCPWSDRDGDGVPDKDDACPNEPGLKKFNGCPDTDGDNIPDHEDECPEKSGPKKFDGCPDTDEDGIPDHKDKCPEKAGPAENDGCPWVDTDGDGIPDHEDECPEKSGPEKFDGCPDTDEDGIPDHKDKCPEQSGPSENNGCPWGDTDGDGIPDKDDACPLKPGPEKFDGCPDTDEDGIPDHKDKCPEKSGPAENDGCPWPDKDGDGVPDHKDKCPEKAGPAENDGCPEKKYKLIVVKDKKIELKQKVYFATGKAVIRRGSFEMLKEVADAIKNASIKKVVVEGHTDSQGPAALNMRLSQKRAESVVKFLVKEGVSSKKLEAKGFGETSPVASNRTKRGRAKNRRVEFRIVR